MATWRAACTPGGPRRCWPGTGARAPGPSRASAGDGRSRCRHRHHRHMQCIHELIKSARRGGSCRRHHYRHKRRLRGPTTSTVGSRRRFLPVVAACVSGSNDNGIIDLNESHPGARFRLGRMCRGLSARRRRPQCLRPHTRFESPPPARDEPGRQAAGRPEPRPHGLGALLKLICAFRVGPGSRYGFESNWARSRDPDLPARAGTSAGSRVVPRGPLGRQRTGVAGRKSAGRKSAEWETAGRENRRRENRWLEKRWQENRSAQE
jgi:hypothetical protein